MPALLWMMHCLLLAKGRHKRPSVPFGGIGVGLMHVCVKYEVIANHFSVKFQMFALLLAIFALFNLSIEGEITIILAAQPTEILYLKVLVCVIIVDLL
jgi:hypothetical protein